MIGANGIVKFALVNKNSSGPRIRVSIRIAGEEPPKKEEEEEPKVIEWSWKITTPPPGIQYIDLEQEAFLSSLMEIVGG